jgi:hypothetical protein
MMPVVTVNQVETGKKSTTLSLQICGPQYVPIVKKTGLVLNIHVYSGYQFPTVHITLYPITI